MFLGLLAKGTPENIEVPEACARGAQTFRDCRGFGAMRTTTAIFRGWRPSTQTFSPQNYVGGATCLGGGIDLPQIHRGTQFTCTKFAHSY